VAKQLRIRDAAELLRVSPDTVRRLVDSGAIKNSRNRFEGIVTRVVKDGVMAQVEMQSGPHHIVSLISREAADELKLKAGVVAVATVKATNVGIELPRR
jgi:molybdopterin-binding protein